jgi:hypothetical protein
MNANPISFVVLAIAALTAGFVLADEKTKTFHDAVDTAFILLKAPVTVAGVSVDYDVSMAGVIVRSQVAVVNMIVRGAFAQDPGRGPGRECPVGGHMRVPSDTHALARVARRQGWRIESLASGHLVWHSPAGARVVSSASPFDWRARFKLRADLRRHGLACR